MKHLSDDEITKGLETLGQSFEPSITQKEKLHRKIFQPNRDKKTFSVQRWIPIIVSFIVLFFIGTGTFFLINDEESTGAGDVTLKWNEVVLHQESSNGVTYYILSFVDGSLTIKDEIIGGEIDLEMSEAEIYEKAEEFQTKKEELTLKAGEYSDYRIKRNKELYEITVPGEKGFTYSLEKIAPRKFIGEDGIRYSANTYTD